MKLDLTGKVAVVSGSTSGIGQGIAAGLAKAGATVVVVGRKQSGVDDAMAAIAAQTPTASLRGVVADLSTEDGVTALIAAVPTADVLVNNLGIFNDKDFFSVPDDEWMHFYNVNVLSGVRLARHYAPGMTEQGWGRIIFVSSESGVAIPGDMINYGVTKAANLAVYLASPLSSATTGAALRVDGGVVDTLTM
ncbi:SDR family NAD(P)-dependent oxidoreductase [Escherichia coli]